MTARALYALGPEGTFSERAAERVRAWLMRERREEARVALTATIADALARAAADPRALGVVPLEDSDAGTVASTQDHLDRLVIVAELVELVRFSLVARGPVDRITRLHAHPVALRQCRDFVARRLGAHEVALADSNAAAAIRFAADPSAGSGAIVAVHAAPRLRAPVTIDGIQHGEASRTRFVVVSARAGAPAPDFSRRKTSLRLERSHARGRQRSARDALAVLAQHAIEPCRCEERPAGAAPGSRAVYVDLVNGPSTPAAIAAVRRSGAWRVTVLGAYDPIPDEHAGNGSTDIG